MATFSDISTRIRQELSEQAEITFSDTELFSYAKEGAKLLYSMIATMNSTYLLTEYVLDDLTFPTLTPTVTTITLPTDCMFIDEIIINLDTLSTKARQTILSEVRISKYSGIQGVPTIFSRMGTTLEFAPTPNDTYEVHIFYVPKYTEPDTILEDFGIDDTFVPYIVEYVTLRAHNRNDRYTLVEQMFLNQKGEILQTLLHKEDPKMMVEPTLTNFPYLQTRW